MSSSESESLYDFCSFLEKTYSESIDSVKYIFVDTPCSNRGKQCFHPIFLTFQNEKKVKLDKVHSNIIIHIQEKLNNGDCALHFKFWNDNKAGSLTKGAR